jgi:hypothetical protein
MQPFERRESVSVVPLFFGAKAYVTPHRAGLLKIVVVDVEPRITAAFRARILSAWFHPGNRQDLMPMANHGRPNCIFV